MAVEARYLRGPEEIRAAAEAVARQADAADRGSGGTMAPDPTTGGGAVLGQHKAAQRAATMAVGVALLAAGCRTDRETTRPEPKPVTQEAVAAALLTAADVPGYTAAADEGTPIATEMVTEHVCDDAIADLEPKETATADFTGTGTRLTSTVAWFPGGGGAVDRFYRDVAEDCEQVVVTSEEISVRTSALDFGVLSDDTLALKFELELPSGAIEERDLIIMREGNLVSIVRLNGPRPSNKELLDSVVRGPRPPRSAGGGHRGSRLSGRSATPRSAAGAGSAVVERDPLEQVATGPDGADGERQRRQPSPEPEHVDVERVATGGARRPPRPAERVAGHHRAVAVEQGRGEAGLDRRQRDPPVTEAEDAVVVEGRRRIGPGLDAAAQAVDACPQVHLAGRDADPVLQVVGGRRRGRGVVLEQQQPRAGLVAELVAPRLLERASARGRHPRGDRRDGRFRGCFAPMKRSRARFDTIRDTTIHLSLCCPAMARQSHLDHLSSVPLFSACSKKELQAVSKASDEVDLPAGRVLCEQGAIGREAFIILEGSAEVRRNKKKVATLGPGACVGELSLLDHGPRTASVIATTDLKVLVIGAREFSGIVDEVPPIAHKILRSLAARVRELDTQMFG